MKNKEIETDLKDIKKNPKKLKRLIEVLTVNGLIELEELEKTYLEYEKIHGDGSMSEKEIKKMFFEPLEKIVKENSTRNRANEELTYMLGQYSEKIDSLQQYCEIAGNFIKDKNIEKEFNRYAREYIKNKKENKISEEEYIEA